MHVAPFEVCTTNFSFTAQFSQLPGETNRNARQRNKVFNYCWSELEEKIEVQVLHTININFIVMIFFIASGF